MPIFTFNYSHSIKKLYTHKKYASLAIFSAAWYNTRMNIFILQKSIANLKSPTVRKPFDTHASTLGDFICEMVEKNSAKKTEKKDRIELFDALESCRSDRFVYDRKTKKFSVDEMKEFALQAFADKIYIVKNVTKNINYESVSADTEFSENDEIALIKLKYVRGAI